ncbi:MAG: hypothetical protein EPO11_10475 [Gammaproteobacteria bacterium]|nr:MAG: hypothetical protein EPO11_10475 [Gammaproteobacteria bacterium]
MQPRNPLLDLPSDIIKYELFPRWDINDIIHFSSLNKLTHSQYDLKNDYFDLLFPPETYPLLAHLADDQIKLLGSKKSILTAIKSSKQDECAWSARNYFLNELAVIFYDIIPKNDTLFFKYILHSINIISLNYSLNEITIIRDALTYCKFDKTRPFKKIFLEANLPNLPIEMIFDPTNLVKVAKQLAALIQEDSLDIQKIDQKKLAFLFTHPTYYYRWEEAITILLENELITSHYFILSMVGCIKKYWPILDGFFITLIGNVIKEKLDNGSIIKIDNLDIKKNIAGLLYLASIGRQDKKAYFIRYLINYLTNSVTPSLDDICNFLKSKLFIWSLIDHLDHLPEKTKTSFFGYKLTACHFTTVQAFKNKLKELFTSVPWKDIPSREETDNFLKRAQSLLNDYIKNLGSSIRYKNRLFEFLSLKFLELDHKNELTPNEFKRVIDYHYEKLNRPLNRHLTYTLS